MEDFIIGDVAVIEPKPTKMFKLRETKIDKFNTLRERVEVHPGMCPKARCPFDIATANGYRNWDMVPDFHKPAMIQAMKEHIEAAHTVQEDSLISEEQMQTQYLNNHFTF